MAGDKRPSLWVYNGTRKRGYHDVGDDKALDDQEKFRDSRVGWDETTEEFLDDLKKAGRKKLEDFAYCKE